jgi:hypothetical protein
MFLLISPKRACVANCGESLSRGAPPESEKKSRAVSVASASAVYSVAIRHRPWGETMTVFFSAARVGIVDRGQDIASRAAARRERRTLRRFTASDIPPGR